MSNADGDLEPIQAAGEVVGRAIEDLAAARLGRAFVPLMLVCLAGIGQAWSGVRAPEGLALAVGAPLAAVASLAYGLRVAQRALGRERRAWMTLAAIGSVIPPALGLYLVGWRGLREVAAWGGPVEVLAAFGFTLLGAWVLRGWFRVLELQRLSEVMGLDGSH